MNTRRYIGALIIVLTFLGVVYQQQNTLPNQEIVLQFSDANLTSDEAQNTIATVKQQLLDIGVDNIQLIEGENGTLKITYFSLTDVTSIKRTLSEENGLDLNSNSQNKSTFPLSENVINYNLNVYEIHNSSDVDWNLAENSVLKVNYENDRVFNPNVYVSGINSDHKEKDIEVKVTLKVRRYIAIAIDNTSYKIPEVRAGPCA
jgi:hypothetical protein